MDDRFTDHVAFRYCRFHYAGSVRLVHKTTLSPILPTLRFWRICVPSLRLIALGLSNSSLCSSVGTAILLSGTVSNLVFGSVRHYRLPLNLSSSALIAMTFATARLISSTT